MTSLTKDQVESLDKVRLRLVTLGNKLTLLHKEYNFDTSTDELQSLVNQVAASLSELSKELSKHEDLLLRTIVSPNAKFPANTAPSVPEHLLATALSLQTQEWVESGVKAAEEASKGLLSDHERNKLWNSAPDIAVQEARKQRWGADYTLAEIQSGVENVKTGLRRELVVPEEESEEDEDDEDEDMEDEEDEEDDKEAMDVDSAVPRIKTTVTDAQRAPAMPSLDIIDMLVFGDTGKDIDPNAKRRILSAATGKR